ncbi:MAG: glycosyltransferase family 39 protein [Patescibacteria group bacterium]
MKNKLLILILVSLTIFTRGYQLVERFAYDHDSDLSAWIVKDITIDHHLRLIGQQTSSKGLFIGPLFYYSLIPFFVIANFDPIGTAYYSIAVGVFGVLSLYFVVTRVLGHKTAFFAALLYATSFLISSTERQVVPTTVIFVWSIWFVYAIYLINQGKRFGLIITSILLALAWHIQLVLIIASLPLLSLVIVRLKKFAFKDFVLAGLVLVVLSAPLILFEIRHDFIQFRSLFFSFEIAEELPRTLSQKVSHVFTLVKKNANFIFWVRPQKFHDAAVPGIILIGSILLLIRKKLPTYLLVIFSAWFGIFILFFISNHINLSEYYFNGLNIAWIILAAAILAHLRKFGWLLLIAIVVYNLYILVTFPINRSGYQYRKQMVDLIATDAAAHSYPCIAISYMTEPGYELGYRYLFWLKDMHVNRPDSNSPVYTIVFPHKLANRLDHTVGALGLVLPDYSRYNETGVKESCSGENSNITDPMFGFTK